MDEIFAVYKEELISNIKFDEKNNNFDNYVNMIINNTKLFIYILMEKINTNKQIENDNIVYHLQLPSNLEFNRNNIKNKFNLWPYDFIFYLDENKKDFAISERILLETIGFFFQISEEYKNTEDETGFHRVPEMIFCIKQDKFQELYDAIMEDDQKIFIKE